MRLPPLLFRLRPTTAVCRAPAVGDGGVGRVWLLQGSMEESSAIECLELAAVSASHLTRFENCASHENSCPDISLGAAMIAKGTERAGGSVPD